MAEDEGRDGPVEAWAVMSSVALAHSGTCTPEYQLEVECKNAGKTNGLQQPKATWVSVSNVIFSEKSLLQRQ